MKRHRLSVPARIKSRRFDFATVWLPMAILGIVLALALPQVSSADNEVLPISYADLAIVLSRFADEKGRVDYAGLKADRVQLDAFVATVGDLDPARFDTWNSAEQMAFYINAYNALTLKAIVDHYPISRRVGRFPANSIRQIPGVWDRLTFAVMGKKRTLNDIEHKILRIKFSEPRIHFALVCAAVSCPPLRNEPYTGKLLDTQLADQANQFMEKRTNFHFEKGVVYLSSIFEWFGDDFVPAFKTESKFKGFSPSERAVLNFVHTYSTGETRTLLLNSNFSIKYEKYDWSLNEKKKR